MRLKQLLVQLETAKNIEKDNNSYSNPKVSTPVEATTFQNSKSQNAVETISGGNETPFDQPNIHNIDNSTTNNNTIWFNH